MTDPGCDASDLLYANKAKRSSKFPGWKSWLSCDSSGLKIDRGRLTREDRAVLLAEHVRLTKSNSGARVKLGRARALLSPLPGLAVGVCVPKGVDYVHRGHGICPTAAVPRLEVLSG